MDERTGRIHYKRSHDSAPAKGSNVDFGYFTQSE